MFTEIDVHRNNELKSESKPKAETKLEDNTLLLDLDNLTGQL